MIQKLIPVCSENKEAVAVCCDCERNCFICKDQECQCSINHRDCDQIPWNYIIKRLNRNIVKKSPQFKAFQQCIEQIFQRVKKQIDKAYSDFSAWKTNFGLTKEQEQFIHLISQNKFDTISGEKIQEIKKLIKLKSIIVTKDNDTIKQQVEKIICLVQKISNQFSQLYIHGKVKKQKKYMNKQNRYLPSIYCMKNQQQYELSINNLKEKISKYKINNHSSLFICQQNIQQQIRKYQLQLQSLLIQSRQQYLALFRILQQKIEVRKQIQYNTQNYTYHQHQQFQQFKKQGQTMVKQFTNKIQSTIAFLAVRKFRNILFQDKQIQQIKLLYRASQNNFWISKFWQQYKKNNKSTITILKTEFGKTIGGYAPYIFHQNNNNNNDFHNHHNLYQSFLFSLTQKSKIPYSDDQGYHKRNNIQNQYDYQYGPYFCRDLIIINNPHNKNSIGNIGISFSNDEYKNNQESIEKFIGQKSGNKFGILQWEIYQITFVRQYQDYNDYDY